MYGVGSKALFAFGHQIVLAAFVGKITFTQVAFVGVLEIN